MFGFRKKTDQQDAQIPYEVYETIQQPTARRRAWFIRLVVALILVTVLIFAGLWLKRTFIDDDAGAPAGDSSQNEGAAPAQAGEQAQPPQTLVQPPQQNTQVPEAGAGSGSPATTPQSSGQNTTTVRKPE